MIRGIKLSRAGNTENQDFEFGNKGTQRFISWEQEEGYPLGRPQYFLQNAKIL